MDLPHISVSWIISINFNSLASLRNNNICPLLVPVWILYSQPHLFFKNHVITSKSFPTDGIFDGSIEVETWGSNVFDVGVKGEEHSIRFFYCFLCSHICVCSCVVVLKEDCGNILVRLNSPETHLQGFKSWRYRPEIMVLYCGTASTKITLSVTESAHDLPCWRPNIKFVLPKRSWTMPFEWLSFHEVHTDGSICHPHWWSV